jgi:TonB family protein
VKKEVLFSFVGHVVLIAVVTIAGALKLGRPKSRPPMLVVQLVGSGVPQPVVESPTAKVIEPKPRVQAKPEPKPETKPAAQDNVVKKHGLGARIEGADALGYAYYLNTILAKIGDNWANPYAGQNKTFTATVYFVVEKDGKLTEVKLEKGSGNAAYDASCTRALLVTQQLPALPPEFTGPRLKLHLEFEYKP